MAQVRASFELATPAFVAGADQTHPELRLPSALGQIRGWWRARQADTTDLRRRESLLFGGPADEDNGIGQGAFVARLTGCQSQVEAIADHFPRGGALSAYAAAEGHSTSELSAALARRRNWLRSCAFSIVFELRPNHEQEVVERAAIDLAGAITTWSSLGGIGWAARRGFGSITCHSLDLTGVPPQPSHMPPRTAGDLKTRIQAIASECRSRSSGLPSFPAFTPQARFWIKELDPNANSVGALTWLAEQMDKTVQCHNSRHSANLTADAFLSDQATGTGLEQTREDQRHPSPAHIHVHPLEDAVVIVVSFLPTSDTSNGLGQRITDFASNADFTEITA